MAAAEVFTSLTENPPHIIMDPKKNFHLFAYLNEDIKMTILSFLADAPFETMPDNYPTSSLTHKLPQVSQKFRRLASSDSYWKDALVRQTKKEPFLWKPALRKLRSHSEDEEGKEGSTQELVEDAFKINNYESYKKLYESVVTQHLRYKGPVFVMAGQVCLGEPYELHFFEPRYRLLIAQVMRDYPEEAKHGGRILNPPCFVHANRGPLAPTTPATLVQVVRCEIFPDGCADVVLLPKAYTWIERIWEKPNCHGLYHAQCLRMGQKTTFSMNQLARQEALTMMMDQLLVNLRDDDDDDDDGGGGGDVDDDEDMEDDESGFSSGDESHN